MRIALVQCPAWGLLPPLGPASLKSYLAAEGHDVRCFDLNIQFHSQQRVAQADATGAAYGGADPWGADSYDQWAFDYACWDEIRFQDSSPFNEQPLPLDEWADQVLADSPAIVGLTCYMTSFASSLQLAERIKQRDPSVTVVLGGPNVASDREGRRALQTGVPDAVVDGEGEVALAAIAEALEAGRGLEDVAGLGLLVGNEVLWTEKRPLIPKVDTLPYPDFTDFDWTSYPNPYQIPIMSSRGCVLACSFCYETVYWKRFRTQSPERIVGEMEHQVATHPLRDQAAADGETFYFMFADSLVNGHIAGLRRMCNLILERGLDVGWGGQATINKKMDAEYCKLLRAAGCKGLAFGLESGSQRVLESMGKHFHIDDAPTMVRDMYEADITVTLNVMVGFPTETTGDFLQTLSFLRKTRKWITQVSNVATTQIALGSDLYAFPEKYGVVIHPDNSWTSEETGTESQRRRRLRVLHAWMTLMRIPHQNIGPSPELESPEEPRPSRRLLREIRAAHGAEPLELASEDGVIQDVDAPEWAAWLEPDSWVGLSLDDLEQHLVRVTDATVTVQRAESPGTGVSHFVVTIEDGGGQRELSAYGYLERTSERHRLLLHAS